MIKKKGFSIIEILIGLSIMSIISLYIIKVTVKYTSNYKIKKEEILEYIYVEEAFNTIKHILDRESSSIVVGDSIKIERYDDKGYDYIRKDKAGNIIISYGAKYSSNTNNVCRGIKEFKVKENGEVIYLKIVGKKGKEYTRCLIKKE
ncbi:prepilin-type N-terminal cleavage/methylation domain-containing protein [Clostridium tepidum]|jgi:prepilin-type N-terminal cleavage/methylation domain-containing protein|uniref:Prepilin-type N-terminal cleavage/methylation domain-containing protein n=1 Tax=Clostridium tepidum TaxID=1962263 RepID=A0A1S9I1N9_9CLOT|nr:type II secretion system protein [Clostridium tepidum]MCR1934172.1 type II secretion system GspH family protein [Clostridium tepidum]MDU6878438.1 type II secretion system protein [Clostridium botulinum]OOO63187.1 prepilin-type N-terminal cleavage/methylation domain-containing protein [Clostridium tepidum]OOO64200.1 prepilin-type N-terminal cleavage/methylation domain-containing protein [Clostridium tepidum]